VRALAPALILLLAGGLAYTLGIVFYAWQRRFHHFVWHLSCWQAASCTTSRPPLLIPRPGLSSGDAVSGLGSSERRGAQDEHRTGRQARTVR